MVVHLVSPSQTQALLMEMENNPMATSQSLPNGQLKPKSPSEQGTRLRPALSLPVTSLASPSATDAPHATSWRPHSVPGQGGVGMESTDDTRLTLANSSDNSYSSHPAPLYQPTEPDEAILNFAPQMNEYSDNRTNGSEELSLAAELLKIVLAQSHMAAGWRPWYERDDVVCFKGTTTSGGVGVDGIVCYSVREDALLPPGISVQDALLHLLCPATALDLNPDLACCDLLRVVPTQIDEAFSPLVQSWITFAKFEKVCLSLYRFLF